MILGSKVAVADPNTSDIRAFVSALDGKLTPHRRFGWDKPTYASPGHHTIQLAASQGLLASEIATSVDLLAGHAYTVRVSWAAETGRLILWVEDGELGAPVSQPVEVTSGLHE